MSDEKPKMEHLESTECWCCPVMEYKDPVNGVEIWVHNTRDEAN